MTISYVSSNPSHGTLSGPNIIGHFAYTPKPGFVGIDTFTYAITDGNRRLWLLPVITLAALSAVTLQLIFEFGPLWLVAVAVPAFFYGRTWAGLVPLSVSAACWPAGSGSIARLPPRRWARP